MTYRWTTLAEAAFTYPMIDQHAHPLLKESHRDAFPIKAFISEATGQALQEDAIETLASYRATRQLAKLYGCSSTWDALKSTRKAMDYRKLCETCMKSTGIQCLLLDDGLDGESDRAESLQWHDQYTSSPTKRIVRIEVLAQTILKETIDLLDDINHMHSRAEEIFSTFMPRFTEFLFKSARDKDVSGFKSIACYRTGLDIAVSSTDEKVITSLKRALSEYQRTKQLRLAHKAFNDYLVRKTLEVAGLFSKPVQFHTGLGDNDIDLAKSSPAHMQPIIKAFPNTIFVLLHSSYPFTREAGYLTSVYKNVYLDFGEVFPCISAEGQRAVVRQVLELCPTNKIMWSTDGHWWPETYYLATMQAREVMNEVLSELVDKQEISEAQAVSIVRNAFFHVANKVYDLHLSPHATQSIITTRPVSSTLQSLISSGIEFIRVQWVDMHNFTRYRVIPVKRLEVLLSPSEPGLVLSKASSGVIDPLFVSRRDVVGQFLYKPDIDSLHICGYAKGHASVMGWFQPNVFEEARPIRGLFCPRALLRDTAERARKCGVDFLVSFEIQFTLLLAAALEAANEHGWSRSSALPSGSIVANVLEEISRALQQSSIELLEYYSDSGLGQYSIITGDQEPLSSVDALVTSRETIINIASKHGLRATFAPRVFKDEPGNNMAVRITPKLLHPSPMATDSPAPFLTIKEACFMQGLMDHLPALSILSLPTPAAYPRLDDKDRPAAYVAWCTGNLACPIQVQPSSGGSHTFDIKWLDGTANPYVAIAAMLMSGILGIEEKATLKVKECRTSLTALTDEQRRTLGITAKMPACVEDARKALKQDQIIREALGDEFIEQCLEFNERLGKEFENVDLSTQVLWLTENY